MRTFPWSVAALAALVACGQQTSPAVAPEAAPLHATASRVVGAFTVEVDTLAGSVKVRQTGADGQLVQLPEGSTGVNKVKVSNAATAFIEADGCSPGVSSFTGNVQLQNLYGVALNNVYAQITSMSSTGYEACNSDTAPTNPVKVGGVAVDATNGLFSYGTLAAAGGADTVAKVWKFALPNTTHFTFAGRVVADVDLGVWVARVTSLANTQAVNILEYPVAATQASPRATYPVTGLQIAGTATSEGFLNRSTDGRYVTFVGYGTSTAGTTIDATLPRLVGRMDSAGTLDISTNVSSIYTGTLNVRSAASSDGSSYYVTGNSAGVYYVGHGQSNPTQVLSSPSTPRVAGIFGPNLYVSSSTALFAATGQPTSGPAVAPGSIITVSSGYQFALLDLDGDGVVDTAYVAIDATSAGKLNVVRYKFSGGLWAVSSPAISLTHAVSNTRGLAAIQTMTGVRVAATDGSEVVYFDDDLGITASPTVVTIATAGTGLAFRGVAFQPLQ